jgi:hypothetical protein
MCEWESLGGGLALIKEGSAVFKKMFGTAPPSIIDGRPESLAIVLKWLIQKEEFLHKVSGRSRPFLNRSLTGLSPVLNRAG